MVISEEMYMCDNIWSQVHNETKVYSGGEGLELNMVKHRAGLAKVTAALPPPHTHQFLVGGKNSCGWVIAMP